MPFWLTILGWAVKGLVFLYGHPRVAEKLAKYTPPPPDPNPPLLESNNPNQGGGAL